MTERKRRKVADARRLHGYVDDLLGISDAITQCAFPRKISRGALPVRSSGPSTTPERSGIPQPQRSNSARSQQRQPQKAVVEPPKTLFSVVSASAYVAKMSASVERETWKQTLLKTAKELAKTDIEAEDRCGRLLRRFDSLAATVDMYQDKVKQLSNEILLNERVELQLEREEKEWEEKMQVREQRVAELEVELKTLQESNEAAFSAGGDGENSQDDNDDDGSDDEDESARNLQLREALALRMEEKRDIQAAIESLRRKKQQRSLSTERTQDHTNASEPSEKVRKLMQELQGLQGKKDSLQLQIIASEEEQEEQDEHSAEIPLLKADIAEKKLQRTAEQDRLDKMKHSLSRLKAKMKHMVDVQILTAGDTSPSTLREEAVILHLLYEHEGEMGVNELKQETGAVMTSHGKPSSNGVVIRALYSLVANGVVQIDRSYGNGLVTSLLV